jgi:site-specific DNA-cytosine methylase
VLSPKAKLGDPSPRDLTAALDAASDSPPVKVEHTDQFSGHSADKGDPPLPASVGSPSSAAPPDPEGAAPHAPFSVGFNHFLQRVKLVELWAGVATLSEAAGDLGIALAAILECDDLLRAALLLRHPEILSASFMEQEEWKEWVFSPTGIVIVVGGPSCTSLSIAGKRDAAKDPTSRYLIDHITVSSFLKASIIMLENVLWLVEGDEEHGLFTALCEHAKSEGYILLHVWRLSDSECGGFTSRKRVFLVWERAASARALPEWPKLDDSPLPPRAITEILMPAVAVPAEAWLLEGVRHRTRDYAKPSRPFKQEILTLQTRLDQLQPGSLVALYSGADKLGCNRWRLIAKAHGKNYVSGVDDLYQCWELRRADRKLPTRRFVTEAAMREGLMEEIPCYSADHVGLGIRGWGELPIGNGFVLLQVLNGDLQPRRLLPAESWAIQGLTPDGLSELRCLGADDIQVASAAGNCITTAMAKKAMSWLHLRLCQMHKQVNEHTIALICEPPGRMPIEPIRNVAILPVRIIPRPACLVFDPLILLTDILNEPRLHASLPLHRFTEDDSTRWNLGGNYGNSFHALGPSQPPLIHADSPLELIQLPLLACGRAHKPASELARSVARQLLEPDMEVILCGQFTTANTEGTSPALLFCAPMALHPAISTAVPAGMVWRTTKDLIEDGESAQLQLLVSLACSAVLSCCPPPSVLGQLSARLSIRSQAEWLSSEWQMAQQQWLTLASYSGARAPKRVLQKFEPSGADETKLTAAIERDALAAELLRVAISAEGRNCDVAYRANFLAWRDSIKPLPMSEMPSGLQFELDDFMHTALLATTVPEPCPVPHTTWLPLALQPLPPADFKPTKLEHLLLPWAIKDIETWMRQQMEFLHDIVEQGHNAERKSNEALALGEDAWQPAARGIVWDLRGLKDGVIVPLDFQAPIQSHLNLGLLRADLADWPDQELLSFLVEGVRYKTHLAPQIVLLPHLISLREGYASLLKEVHKYTDMGWYGLFSTIPFLPFRAVPKGSVPRKSEPDRPRPTTEAGAPRKMLQDTAGVAVISLNEASSGLTPQSVGETGERETTPVDESRWPKENKPTVGHALAALAHLKMLGALINEPVYSAADDYKNFFNQLMLSNEQIPTCGMVLSQDGVPAFAAEYIMTFGLRPASGIAQRFADAIRHIWLSKMDAAEQSHICDLRASNSKFDAWCSKHTEPVRLAVSLVYTDDMLFLVVGAERMARALRIWSETVHSLGLMMAGPEKRQCGTWVEWLGAGISSSLGVGWVPTTKVLKALSKLQQTCYGTILVHEYHSLLGLLEHLVFLIGLTRSNMYHMWSPFRKGVALEPNRKLETTPNLIRACESWINRLSCGSAVSAMRMIHFVPDVQTPLVFTIYSDAATDRADSAGVGGWMHGHTWGYQLTPVQTRELTIPVIEFIAGLVSLATFAPLLPPLDPDEHIVHLRVDALATPFVLTDASAKAPAMVAVHQAALQSDTFTRIFGCLVCSHCFGVGNECADAASRLDTSRLQQLARQLHVAPCAMEPHDCLHFLLATALNATH